MKTYSRKKPEYQLIENVHEMCRLCLGKRTESIPIFPSQTDNMCISLALRIMICVGLEISEEECLPSMICKECCEELDKYYSFRKKCAHTYQRLKSHVLAIKNMNIGHKVVLDTTHESNNNIEANVNHSSSAIEVIPLVLNEDNQLIIKTDENEPKLRLNSGIDNKSLTHESVDSDAPIDISEFLSTILVKLGIVTKRDELFVGADLDLTTVQLETVDGCQISLDLLECPDEENVPVNEPFVNGLNQERCPANNAQGNSDRNTLLKPLDGRPQCDECGKRFATHTVLRRHALVHTGEKPYACCVCPRRFSQREVLKRHQLVHEVRRPYQCGACPKSFTQRGALTAHERTHAPPHARALQLHRCPQCPKMFLHASGLSRHQAGHAGRTHLCTACNRQFGDRSSLRRHLARNPQHAQQPQHAHGAPAHAQPDHERHEESRPAQQQNEQLAAHAQYAQLVQHTQIDS